MMHYKGYLSRVEFDDEANIGSLTFGVGKGSDSLGACGDRRGPCGPKR